MERNINIWKSIFAHKWNTTLNGQSLYDIGVKYLKGENEVIKSMSPDSKRDFTNRMKIYSLNPDETRLQFVTTEHPNWMNYTFNSGEPLIFNVIKPSEIEDVISKFFSDNIYTASNYKTVYDKILRSKYLGISRNDVYNYLKKNPPQRNKLVNVGGKPFIKSYRPKYPFEHWQIDHINLERFADSNKLDNKKKQAYKYVLVVIDIFSKFVYLYPCISTGLSEVMQILQKIFLSGDIPEKLGADNAFNKYDFIQFCKGYEITFIAGLPYSPETQGFVENKNKQVKTLISMHFNKYGTQTFFNVLDQIAFTINNTKHSITNQTPLSLHRGREVNVSPPNAIKEMSESFIQNVQLLNHYENNGSQCEQIDARNYNESSKLLYQSRIEHARNLIHHAASKREEKMEANKLPLISKNQFVFIAAYRDLGDSVQPIILRLVSGDDTYNLTNPLHFKKKDPVIPGTIKYIDDYHKYAKSLFGKMLLKLSKFKWIFKDNDPDMINGRFKVSDVQKRTNRSFYYNIVFIDANNKSWKVQMLKRIGNPSEYSEEFPREIVLEDPRKSVSKENYKPKVQYIDLVSREGKPTYLSNESVNNSSDTSNENVKPNNVVTTLDDVSQNIDSLHKKALDLFIKYTDDLKKKKVVESFILKDVKIKYAWTHVHDRDPENVFWQFIKQPSIIQKWDLKLKRASEDPLNVPWLVRFPEEKDIQKKDQFLSLDPTMYAFSDTEPGYGSWYFLEPSTVIKKLRKFDKNKS